MNNLTKRILSLSIPVLMLVQASYGQIESKPDPGKETEFQGFSAERFPAKKSTRGTSVVLEDLTAFSSGSIKLFNFQSQYKKVFLGSDFFEEANKEKACDTLQRIMGRNKSHFVPVADGMFFSKSDFNKIEELEGYYRFRNSKNLPGILPNVDVWLKMESYKHAKSAQKNCLVIKFLIPEDVNGKIEEHAYVMRNDGILVAIPAGTDPDFSLKLDFNQYCIFPLNDVQETTHLIGREFNIMGSFARQKQCKNLNGLLFPVTRKGTSTGCVFFRKIDSESSPRF